MKLDYCTNIDDAWPTVAPWLAAACDPAVWTIDDARHELQIGNAALWILTRDEKPCAALLTQVDTNTNTGIIALVGGENVLRGACQHLWKIERWATFYGAKRMAMNGRKGWVRFLKPFGYRAEGTTVIKDL